MGISKVVGLSGAILLSATLSARRSGMPVPSLLLLLHAALVHLLVAVASLPAFNLPQILGKTPRGSFPLWSVVLFAPFLLTTRLYLILKRSRRSRDRLEPMFSEVDDGLFVGGWATSPDLLPPGSPAVVDCTCEFPRSPCFAGNAYLCVPTWDTRSPTVPDIDGAVRWACERRAEGKPVYIHCANGHGRSVCVLCALLVALGVAEDWKAAESMVRTKRPFIRVNAIHRKHLEEWSKLHASAKENSNLVAGS